MVSPLTQGSSHERDIEITGSLNRHLHDKNYHKPNFFFSFLSVCWNRTLEKEAICVLQAAAPFSAIYFKADFIGV